jgi:hypothetical protein
MKMNKILIYILIFVMFVWGLIFISKQPIESKPYKENFISTHCATTLIKDGNTILMYDPNKAEVPGVNPVRLKNLQEYLEFIKWQRANHLKCPILHLEKVYTTQGNHMYEIRKNFIDKDVDSVETGFVDHNKTCAGDANTTNNVPFNANQFPAFDPENQSVGIPAIRMALSN